MQGAAEVCFQKCCATETLEGRQRSLRCSRITDLALRSCSDQTRCPLRRFQITIDVSCEQLQWASDILDRPGKSKELCNRERDRFYPRLERPCRTHAQNPPVDAQKSNGRVLHSLRHSISQQSILHAPAQSCTVDNPVPGTPARTAASGSAFQTANCIRPTRTARLCKKTRIDAWSLVTGNGKNGLESCRSDAL